MYYINHKVYTLIKNVLNVFINRVADEAIKMIERIWHKKRLLNCSPEERYYKPKDKELFFNLEPGISPDLKAAQCLFQFGGGFGKSNFPCIGCASCKFDKGLPSPYR
jgi:hypothetical protein